MDRDGAVRSPADAVTGMVNRRLLAVLAHPDDETFLAGGTIARRAVDGWDVRLITMTRGEAGRRGRYGDLSQAKLEFSVTARRVDASGSLAACKDAR